MKKLYVIFLMITFSTPLFAAGPLENIKLKLENSLGSSTGSSQLDVSSTSSDNKGGFLSKIGSGIKSGFGKVKDALGLSSDDIEKRQKYREKKKADSKKTKAAATAEEGGMLDAAITVGEQFDDRVDEILASDEATDPSRELEDAEKTYREEIEALTAGKSGKTVDSIKQDMEVSIKEARNLINKNPDKLKEFRNDATSANRTNMIDKAITGVSTAAMGLGAMQLAQGLSEQKSDKAATAEMQNYLSNLYCTYSDKQVKYGVTDVKIDDGNNLDLLREEFLTKAATLKYTKEQLGLKAGLESEVVFDDAATALYNNQGTSRGNSKFGRLSKAIMDESGSDAQIIAAQQEKSKNRVTGGAIAVVGGVAASIGGNALINKVGTKDKNNKIKEEYQKDKEDELSDSTKNNSSEVTEINKFDTEEECKTKTGKNCFFTSPDGKWNPEMDSTKNNSSEVTEINKFDTEEECKTKTGKNCFFTSPDGKWNPEMDSTKNNSSEVTEINKFDTEEECKTKTGKNCFFTSPDGKWNPEF